MTTVEIHKFIEGPFELDDGTWYNLCLAWGVPAGVWAEVEIYYFSYDAAYEDSININRSPYPTVVDAHNLWRLMTDV